MKLIDLYRDIFSILNDYGAENYQYGYNDIVSAINDSISTLRIEYVKNGRYQEFVETHSIFATVEDFQYPFLSSFELPKPILGEIPINLAIVSANVQQTTNVIKKGVNSYPANYIAVKDNIVYRSIRKIENEDTYNKTFNISDVYHYRTNNKLKYNKDTVVKDITNNKYYKVLEDFMSVGDNSDKLEEVVWQEMYENNKPVFFYEFTDISQMKLFTKYNDEAYVFSVVRDKIFVAPKVERFTVSYIPRWEKVTEMNDDVVIPDFMISAVKQNALQRLVMKFNTPQTQAQENET